MRFEASCENARFDGRKRRERSVGAHADGCDAVGWLRKHVLALLRRLLSLSAYDLSVEAWLLARVHDACRESTIAALFTALRTSVW